MKLFIENHGDANHYMLTDEDHPNNWVAVVKFNGEISLSHQKQLANQLAAAPELLEALKYLQNHFDYIVEGLQYTVDGMDDPENQEIAAKIDSFKILIAKAEGEN